VTRPKPDPAVVALAREVERLRERIAHLDAIAGEAKRMAEAAHRVLPELADRVASVAGDRAELAGQVDNDAISQSWLVNQRPEMLVRLREWLEQVLIHYPDAASALGTCWPLHPWIVEELLALRAAWLEAYEGERGSGTRAVDWHDRLRPGVIGRLSEHTAGCSPEAHRPGGRLDLPARMPEAVRLSGQA
jgi:hypothetical protein